MKQIFEILQEERDRILNIHKSATKNQYLNVLLNEAAYAIDAKKYSLKTNDLTDVKGGEIKVIGGITYAPTQRGNLSAKGEIEYTNSGARKKTTISFICANNKINADGKYYDVLPSDTTFEGFRKLCETLKNKKKESYGVQQTLGKSVQGYTQANVYTLKSKDGKQSITIPAKTGYTLKKDKNGNVGATFRIGPTIFGWFGCKSKSFFINKVIYKDEKNFLADNISKAICGGSSSTTPETKTQQQVVGTGSQSTATVVAKPTEAALDLIIQKIPAGSQQTATTQPTAATQQPTAATK